MKKLLDEISFFFDDYETKPDPNSSFFEDLFHLILWGGGFLIMMFAVVIFILFVLAFINSNFQESSPLLYLTLAAIFVSYIMKKLRIIMFHKKD